MALLIQIRKPVDAFDISYAPVRVSTRIHINPDNLETHTLCRVKENPFGYDLPLWILTCNGKQLGLMGKMWKRHIDNGAVTIAGRSSQ